MGRFVSTLALIGYKRRRLALANNHLLSGDNLCFDLIDLLAHWLWKKTNLVLFRTSFGSLKKNTFKNTHPKISFKSVDSSERVSSLQTFSHRHMNKRQAKNHFVFENQKMWFTQLWILLVVFGKDFYYVRKKHGSKMRVETQEGMREGAAHGEG